METKNPCRHTEGPAHTCAYVDGRNDLIPEATRRATARVSPEDRFGNAWSRIFADEMAVLAAEAMRQGKL